MKKQFSKRTYHSLKEIAADLKFMHSNRKNIHALMNTELVSETFRERLMMAVTSVNDCRYCSYYHSREALKAGISPEEIATLTSCEFGDCPDEEQPALLYAQHWAESNTLTDEEAYQRVLEFYGEEKLNAIEMVLRMIRMGNLMGNTLDYLLFKLSFGLLGT
ncbi:MAG: carboxymuconolactone decarboxylase family protein [Anaerolineaceae bacterium]|nr:carboxymuconolactone decarboxylase family protein [Anaerolineaceae bacterium]